MAVLYISRGKPLCFTSVLDSSSSSSSSSYFQMLISEVTERIPFILSHNIRSGCNLIMYPKSLYISTRQKNHQKTPKWAFRRPSLTLDGNNFTMKLLIDNRRLSALWGTLLGQPPKARELRLQNEGLVWVNIWHHIVKLGTPLISLELWEIKSWNFTHI